MYIATNLAVYVLWVIWLVNIDWPLAKRCCVDAGSDKYGSRKLITHHFSAAHITFINDEIWQKETARLFCFKITMPHKDNFLINENDIHSPKRLLEWL